MGNVHRSVPLMLPSTRIHTFYIRIAPNSEVRNFCKQHFHYKICDPETLVAQKTSYMMVKIYGIYSCEISGKANLWNSSFPP